MKYSVILPIYNAAETLRRCLESLVGQLQDHTELLLIDDGSTDGSAQICAEYAARNPQIRLLSKENGGVSSARNLGLEMAQGEYVLFVDADDAVSDNYFSIVDNALRDRPELLIFGAEQSGQKRQIRCSQAKPLFCQGSRCVPVLASALRRQEFNLITTKAFRRDLIARNRIRFEERLDIGEDKLFSFAYAVHVNSVRIIPDRLYYLSMDRRDSLSRKRRDNLLSIVLLEHELLIDTLKRADLPKNAQKSYDRAIQYSYYRSAYTVCKKARQDVSPAAARGSTGGILRAYARDPRFCPRDLACQMIALPIRLRWTHGVNAIVSFFLKGSDK